MSSTRNLTPDQVADRCQKVLGDVPPDELVEASVGVIVTLCSSGLYAEAAALCRRGIGVTEERVYNLLMIEARRNGHDEGLVFEAVYGL